MGPTGHRKEVVSPSPLQAPEGKGAAPRWGDELFSCRGRGGGEKQQPMHQKPSGKEFLLCKTAPAQLQLTFPSHTLLPQASRCQSAPKTPTVSPRRRDPSIPGRVGGTRSGVAFLRAQTQPHNSSPKGRVRQQQLPSIPLLEIPKHGETPKKHGRKINHRSCLLPMRCKVPGRAGRRPGLLNAPHKPLWQSRRSQWGCKHFFPRFRAEILKSFHSRNQHSMRLLAARL